MNEKYRGGLTIYDDDDKHHTNPTEFLLDQNKSTETELYFLAYDANLWPSPNIDTWNPDYIKEVCRKICDRLKTFDGVVYLDGFLLDREKRELVKKEEQK